MLTNDAVRIGIDAARCVVRGDPYEHELVERVQRVFQADSGAGLTRWAVVGGEVGRMESLVLSVAGAARLTHAQIATAESLVGRHPSFGAMLRGRDELRLSDAVDLRRFWASDVYAALHGHSDGRYPSALVLRRGSGSLLFLGIHRQVRDLTDAELAALAELGRPLRAALAFRASLDRAIAQLADVPDALDGPFTPPEAEVIALVSRGWTTARIAHTLGLSESGVRYRVRSARDRIGAGNRSELIARWARIGRPSDG